MGIIADILQYPFSRRQKLALLDRTNWTRDCFIEELGRSMFEREVAAELWDYLREESVVDDFRPLPDDSLIQIYGIAEEELDEDIILMLLRRFEVSIPDEKRVKDFGPVRTPRDIISFITMAKDSVQTAPGKGV